MEPQSLWLCHTRRQSLGKGGGAEPQRGRDWAALPRSPASDLLGVRYSSLCKKAGALVSVITSGEGVEEQLREPERLLSLLIRISPAQEGSHQLSGGAAKTGGPCKLCFKNVKMNCGYQENQHRDIQLLPSLSPAVIF